MNITKNFTIKELTRSSYAIRHNLINEPSPDLKKCVEILKPLAEKMELVREIVERPIIVLSGYRSDVVNHGVGGSRTSAHMFAAACDFNVEGMGVKAVWDKLSNYTELLDYDQLIDEFGEWVHIGWRPFDGQENRNQLLLARKVNGQTVYK